MDQQQVPLVATIGTRDGTRTKDSLMVNCYVEQSGKDVYAKRRAGLGQFTAFSGPTAVLQGSFVIAGIAYAIWNDTVYNVSTGTSYPIPVVTTGSWPDVLGQQYSIIQSTQNAYVLIQNGGALYKFTGTAFTRVVPQSTGTVAGDKMTPGIAELDGTVYVLTVAGYLYGSALNDPTTWPALNYNQPSTSMGQGMGINRHLSYVQCYYSTGSILYYNAGQFPGLPVLPVQNGASRIGCAAGKTIVEIQDSTYFLAYSKDSGRTVQRMTGLGMEVISTPEVELAFQDPNLNLTTVCYGVQMGGHDFYVMTFVYGGFTLVYDTTTKQWAQWTQTVGGVTGYYRGAWPIQQGSFSLMFDYLNGKLYFFGDSYKDDNGAPIQMLVRTVKMDWGTYHRKFFGSLMLRADTANEVVNVRWTDDDYNTWTAYQQIDLSTEKKQLLRTGSSISRAWEVLYTGQTQIRLYHLLPEVVAVET